jgi:hypothetical protein
MGWLPYPGGLSPPANVRHPAGVRWGPSRKNISDLIPRVSDKKPDHWSL